MISLPRSFRPVAFLLLGISAALHSGAQTATIPAQLPARPQPANNIPKLKVYAPADLVITQTSLRSVTRNDPGGSYTVTVSVVVHNNGEQGSDPLTKLKGFYAGAAGFYKAPTPYPLGANDPGQRIVPPWTYCAAEPSIGRVDGGNTWSGDLSFDVLYQSFSTRGEKFYLLLLADYYNNTKESNEHNNYSVPIFITPPR